MKDNIHPNGYWVIQNKKYRFDKWLAAAIVSFAKRYDVKDIIDVGCGNGAYTFYLNRCGFSVDGFDGNPYTIDITDGECGIMDFSEPLKLRPRDLVLCLEVAEHIPAEKEGVFIDNILAPMSDHVVISWAVEGQGGLGHVNCRSNDYVIDRFAEYGYSLMKDESNRLRKASKISWFKNTIMVYERSGGSAGNV